MEDSLPLRSTSGFSVSRGVIKIGLLSRGTWSDFRRGKELKSQEKLVGQSTSQERSKHLEEEHPTSMQTSRKNISRVQSGDRGHARICFEVKWENHHLTEHQLHGSRNKHEKIRGLHLKSKQAGKLLDAYKGTLSINTLRTINRWDIAELRQLLSVDLLEVIIWESSLQSKTRGPRAIDAIWQIEVPKSNMTLNLEKNLVNVCLEQGLHVISHKDWWLFVDMLATFYTWQ